MSNVVFFGGIFASGFEVLILGESADGCWFYWRRQTKKPAKASGSFWSMYRSWGLQVIAIWLSDVWFVDIACPFLSCYFTVGCHAPIIYMDGCLQWPFWCWDWTRLQCLRFQQHLSLWEEDIQGVQLSDRQIFFRCVKNLYSLWNTALPEKMKEK